MSYHNLLKNDIKLKEFETVKVSNELIGTLCCQYNPDRFEQWKSTFPVPYEKNYLHLENSPHVTLLQQYVSRKDEGKLNEFWKDMRFTRYYILQEKYGRSFGWIDTKIRGFINLFEDIRMNGMNCAPQVLDAPVISSVRNESDFEIYEGHHRLAACLVAGKDVNVDVYQWVEE